MKQQTKFTKFTKFTIHVIHKIHICISIDTHAVNAIATL